VRVALTAADFEAAGLGDQLADIEAAVADHLDGSVANVAVVAEPYAGRDVLLSYAEEHLGAAAAHVSFDEVVTEPDALEFPNHEVVVVEGCHYLYARRIGGFDVLDAFLEHIATADELYVTAWNKWAWDYLVAVRDVDRAFPVQVDVPRLEAESITSLVNAHVDEMPAFVETGDHGRVKTVDFDRVSVGVGDRELVVPIPELNLEYVTARDLGDEYGEVERVVYEKLTRLAEGNPGVALALWDRAVRDGEMAPAFLDERDRPLDLDDDEAMALTTVLCKERLSVDTLESLLPGVAVAQAIQTLSHQRLVDVETEVEPGDGGGDADGGEETETTVVSVAPERFHAAVEHLEGRRLLW
jgi:hypothetical protein